MTTDPQPKREVWQIDLKLVSPITGWDSRYSGNFWHVKVAPSSGNGLTKASAVDVLQSRGVDL